MAQPVSHNRYPTELAATPGGHERENFRQSPNDQSLEPGYEWVALSVTTAGALLASLQGSSLIIALPDVLTGLGASFLTLMWVLLGYLLITTALVPVVGRAADIFGRKRLYVAGFAVFTVGSLLGGLAQPQFHGWDLVAYRVLQGIGGALLITKSHSWGLDRRRITCTTSFSRRSVPTIQLDWHPSRSWSKNNSRALYRAGWARPRRAAITRRVCWRVRRPVSWASTRCSGWTEHTAALSTRLAR